MGTGEGGRGGGKQESGRGGGEGVRKGERKVV